MELAGIYADGRWRPRFRDDPLSSYDALRSALNGRVLQTIHLSNDGDPFSYDEIFDWRWPNLTRHLHVPENEEIDIWCERILRDYKVIYSFTVDYFIKLRDFELKYNCLLKHKARDFVITFYMKPVYQESPHQSSYSSSDSSSDESS